ncbi:MAG: patatin-like protein [Hyphomicrobiales bacterium]
MNAAPKFELEQEMRFAVVLYGGASLAIYINGVAQELLRMVRSTADLGGEELRGTEKIYRELGRLLGVKGPSGDAPQPSDPIRTRFIVDIVSGTSAGGINAVALAKALAVKAKDLSALKNTWLDEAQMDLLLNDSASDYITYPQNPEGKTASLLNSERMYGKILETLAAMNDPGHCSGGAEPFVDKLDLFITATDLNGLSAPIQITGTAIDERVHRTVFHFEYSSPGEGQSSSEPINELGPECDPMLAFAARSTSSFPVAFEPMRFNRITNQLKAQKIGLTGEKPEQKFKDFFPAYTVKNEDFTGRSFADGGYLDNKPFSYAIDLIPYRSSSNQVRRKLLFVDPFPEIEQQRKALDRKDISFIDNALMAATTLPRYEVIRGDIRAVNAINRRLDRLAWLRERVEKDQPSSKDRPSPPDFRAADLRDMVQKYEYGEFYPWYHHLRVFEVTDALAEIVTRLAGFEVDSDEYYFLREILRCWREAHFSTYCESGKETENAYFDRFDAGYRLRRLAQTRSVVDKKLRKQPDRDAREALNKIRNAVEVQLSRLGERIRCLASRTRSPLLKEDSPTHGSLAALRSALPVYFPDVMNVTDRYERHEGARNAYTEPRVRSHVDAIMAEIAHLLKEVFDHNREDMAKVLPADIEEAELPPDVADVRQAYRLFHWHDALSLPFLEGSDATEHAEIGIYRVSPTDSSLAPAYLEGGSAGKRTGKLRGTNIGAFGGFLKREWREHDMMWGRLDGAERIVAALLPDPRHQDLRRIYIARIQDAILAEEFSPEDPRSRDRIFEWLAHTLVGSGSSRDFVKLVQSGEDLLKQFPTLQDAINKKDFREFLLRYYTPPPWPERGQITGWTARALKILGRMIDDLPDETLGPALRPGARVMKGGGVLLTELLHFATPQSIGRTILDHWLVLISLAGALLVIVGLLVGSTATVLPGVAVLLICLSIWVVARLFATWVRGGPFFGRLARAIAIGAAVIVIVLAGLGVMKAWEMAAGISDSLVLSHPPA